MGRGLALRPAPAPPTCHTPPLRSGHHSPDPPLAPLLGAALRPMCIAAPPVDLATTEEVRTFSDDCVQKSVWFVLFFCLANCVKPTSVPNTFSTAVPVGSRCGVRSGAVSPPPSTPPFTIWIQYLFTFIFFNWRPYPSIPSRLRPCAHPSPMAPGPHCNPRPVTAPPLSPPRRRVAGDPPHPDRLQAGLPRAPRGWPGPFSLEPKSEGSIRGAWERGLSVARGASAVRSFR